jgi:FHS family L-fucose permease-like MFS transporter
MSKDSSRQFMVPLILMGMLFFIFGFVTWLNGILIPYLQIACELTNFQAVFVAFSFYISYTLMAIPSARILEKIGFKSGIMLGLLIMAVGTALFIPSAMYRTYAAFLLGLFIMGTGLALMQTAVNPYITILGPRETATVRLSIMGICNNVAGAIGPLVLAYYILSDGDEIVNRLKTLDLDSKNLLLDNLSRRVVTPYIIMTAVLVGMGALVKLSPLPDIEDDAQDLNEAEESGKTSIFQFPHLILGVITLFVYVGVEVIAANTIFSYGISLGVPIESAKTYTTLVMITMLLRNHCHSKICIFSYGAQALCFFRYCFYFVSHFYSYRDFFFCPLVQYPNAANNFFYCVIGTFQLTCMACHLAIGN